MVLRNCAKSLLVPVLFCLLCDQAVPQAVNPCVALKLPLCKLTKDFARSNGLQSTAAAPRRPSPPKKTLPFVPTLGPISTTAPTTQRPTTTLPAFNSEGDCKGLRFCILKKDADKRQPIVRLPSELHNPTSDVVSIVTPASVPLVAAEPSSSESLLSAVLNGHIDTAKQLIEDGADVNAQDVHGNTVLLIASQNGRTEVIDDLLLGGADVNHGNNHKNTALHLAAQNGWTMIAVHLLKAKKIKVNKADLHANTALHLAAQNGQIGVTQVLLDRPEIEVNKPNTHGLIPLHLAAQNGHLELARMLVQAGSDLDYADLIGNTPLHTAVHTTHRNIANMLVQAGANERKTNLSGLTPFQLG